MCCLLGGAMHWYSAWALWLLINVRMLGWQAEEELNDQKYQEMVEILP